MKWVIWQGIPSHAILVTAHYTNINFHTGLRKLWRYGEVAIDHFRFWCQNAVVCPLLADLQAIIVNTQGAPRGAPDFTDLTLFKCGPNHGQLRSIDLFEPLSRELRGIGLHVQIGCHLMSAGRFSRDCFAPSILIGSAQPSRPMQTAWCPELIARYYFSWLAFISCERESDSLTLRRKLFYSHIILYCSISSSPCSCKKVLYWFCGANLTWFISSHWEIPFCSDGSRGIFFDLGLTRTKFVVWPGYRATPCLK